MELVLLVIVGLAAGTLGSLLGLGGGIFVVPALILLRHESATVATGTAVAVIVPTMAVALWRRGVQGHVDWQMAALLAVGAVTGAFIGSHLAGKLSPIVLRRLFAGVMIVIGMILFLKR